MQVLSLGAGGPQTLSLSGVSAVSSALTSTQDSVRLWSSVDCFVQFGIDATVVATTASHPMTAKIPEIFQIGNNHFLAAIVSTGTGTLFISPLS